MITVEYENTRTQFESGVSFTVESSGELIIYDIDNKPLAAFNGQSWKRVDIESPGPQPQ